MGYMRRKSRLRPYVAVFFEATNVAIMEVIIFLYVVALDWSNQASQIFISWSKIDNRKIWQHKIRSDLK